MKKVLNFFSEYKGIIKTSLVSALVLFLIIFISMNGCNKKRANRLSQQLVRIEVENSLMKSKIISLHLEIANKIKVQDSLRLAFDEKELQLKKLREEYVLTSKELEKLKVELAKIPAEESYEFLITKAYPFKGELKFPFNEPQVKAIHLNWIENRSLKDLNLNLTQQVISSDLMIEDLNSLNEVCENKYDLLLESEIQYKNMLENTEKSLSLTEKELTKIRRSNKAFYYGLGGTALGGFLLGFLIFN